MRKSQAEAGVDRPKVVSNYSTVIEWICLVHYFLKFDIVFSITIAIAIIAKINPINSIPSIIFPF